MQDDVIEQIFDVMIRDFSRFALTICGKPIATAQQQEISLEMIRRPVLGTVRYERVWKDLLFALEDARRRRPAACRSSCSRAARFRAAAGTWSTWAWKS